MTDRIGPYELRGQLGRGAMAVVWRAWDPKLEREVAIKEPVLPSGADASAAIDMSARFVREGKAAAALNHPGIVTIYAADVYDGRPAIVMELIEGETLSDVLTRGPLSPSSSLAVLDQLLDAVGYAHARSVVHRDIKPDNVFVTLDGRVKLADFGIAHMGTTAALTQAGAVMGTPGYMAPEQITGQSADSRADIFAIGVIGHELMTGHNPFGATDGVAPTTIMYRIVHEAMPQLPASVSAGLPANVAGVLSVATAKDPSYRFETAQAFRSALHGGPIGAAPVVPAPTWSPAVAVAQAPSAPSSTNWTPYLIVGAIGVVAVGLLFVFAGGPVGGTRGAVAVPPQAVSTPTAPVETPATSAGGTTSEQFLTDSYSQIGKIDSSISKLAKTFNSQASQGVPNSTVLSCENMLNRVEVLLGDVQAHIPGAGLSDVRNTQIQLLKYCVTRAQALVDGCYSSQAGGDYTAAVKPGHIPKVRFDKLYPHGRP